MSKVKQTFLDKLVSFVSPQAGVQRMMAKKALTKFEYDAVKYTRERRGPSNLSGAEDYRSNYDRVELMKRARDLAENNGLVRSLLLKFASHVAANITYQARTESPKANTEIEAYWNEWFENCDLSTRHTGSTLMQVATVSMLRDGDFLFVLVRDKNGDLRLQGIEADRLGDPYKTYTSLELIGGIHIDRDTGAPTAYDIYNRSIGDFYTYQITIPSSQAFHYFDPLRIDQYRGISAFHTAINDATDIYDIVNFEKLAAKVASSQSAIVKRTNNNASDLSTLTTEENFDNQPIKLESMESGKISYLEPGEDIVFPDGPSRPSGAFAEFHKILLRNICMGLGIPYSFAVDPSSMSGPTARLEMQQAGRTFKRYQKLLDDKVLRPLKNIVVADAVARGIIKGNGKTTTKGFFNFGANVSIDLGRESASAIAEFKAGLRTASDIYSERGMDVEAALRARAIETKMIQDLAKEYGVPPQAVSEILLPTGQPQAQAEQPTQDGQQVEGQPDLIGQSLNGAQVASLINVINAVAAGALSKEGAVSVITAAFPTISREQAIGIVAGVQTGKMIPTTEKEKQAAQDGQQEEGDGGSAVQEEPKAPVAPTGLAQKKSNLELADDGCGREDDGTFGPGNTCATDGGGGAGETDKPNKANTKSNELWKLTKKEFFHPQISRKFIDSENEKDGTIIGNIGDLIHGEKTRELLKPVLDVPVMILRTPVVNGEKIETGEDFVFDGASGTFQGKPAIFINPNSKMVGTLYEEAAHQMRRATGREIKKADIKKIISGDDDFNKMYENDPEEISAKRMAKYIGTLANKEKSHEEIVRDALKAGKKVPQNVLKEYNLSSETAIVRELNQNELKMLIAGMMGGIELGKYDGIDFTPPEGAREAAKRALDVREKKPASQKGMTAVGIARARDLMNGVKLSPDTVRRMKAFFDRHEVDKKGETWDEQGKGWQAWNGWGGDAGYAWARKVVRQMEARDKNLSDSHEPTELAEEDAILNPCGMKDDGTFDDENTCATGYGRPKKAGGYTPKRPGGKIPKQAPKPQPPTPKADKPARPTPPPPPKPLPPPSEKDKERSRIAEKMRKGGTIVALPQDLKIAQQIEKEYDNLIKKGYTIPPPDIIATEQLKRRFKDSYAIATTTYNIDNTIDRQYITYNSKYDNDTDKGLLKSVEKNVKEKWFTSNDTFSHEYGHILHHKKLPYGDARRYRTGKFGTGRLAEQRKQIAGEVSTYAQRNPMEFVAETFAGHVNGKKYSSAVMEMYKFYNGPELK